MKIAYVFSARREPVTGVEGKCVHIQEMCSAFASLGHEVVLLSADEHAAEHDLPFRTVTIRPSSSIVQALVQRERKRSTGSGHQEASPRLPSWGMRNCALDLLRLGWSRVWDEAFVAPCRDALRSEQPDLVYERYVPGMLAAARACNDLGLHHAVEMNASFTFPNEWWHSHSPLYPGTLRARERKLAMSADHVFVVSLRLREYLTGLGVPPEKVTWLPNAADPERFHPAQSSGEAIRRKYGLSDHVVAGFVGAFRRFHDLDGIIDAARLLAADKIKFLLVGEGPSRPRIEERIRREGLGDVVRVTGRVNRESVPAFVGAMDIALAPAPRLPEFHFSPLKLFEYMAAGRAVVASRYPDIEAVIADMRNGLLVPPGDASALADGIRTLARNPKLRERLGSQARRDVEEKFTWKQNALRVLKETMGVRSEPAFAA